MVRPADSTFSVAESTESKWDGSCWQNPESVFFFWPVWADLSSEDIDFDCDTGRNKSVIDP